MAIRVLSLIHQEDAPTGVFADAVAAAGHELEEASLALDRPLARDLDNYGALMLMGGGMDVDQDDEHPWLREEKALIAAALGRRLPLLGVCLGSQLLAEVAGAAVGPLGGGPEIGWHEVQLETTAAGDPVLAALPRRFTAFEWHSYGFDPPPGAALLATSAAGPQAYRLGGSPAWGVQFHAELSAATLAGWLESYGRDEDVRAAGIDPARLAARGEREIGRWNELGRGLCAAFLGVAASA